MAKERKKQDPLKPKKSGEDRAHRIESKRDPARPINQMMPYLLVILAVFLFLCILFVNQERTGIFGKYLCDGLYIALGRCCLLLPILMLNLAVFWRRDRASGQLVWKIGVSCVFLVLVCGLLQLRYLGKGFFSLALDRRGAGAVGWAVGETLHRLLGTFGTIWIVGMVLIVLFPFLVGTTPRQVIVGIVALCRRLRDRKKEHAAHDTTVSTGAPTDVRPQRPFDYAQTPYTTPVNPQPTPTPTQTAKPQSTPNFIPYTPTQTTNQGQPTQQSFFQNQSHSDTGDDFYDPARFAPTTPTKPAAPSPSTASEKKQKRAVPPSTAPYMQGAATTSGHGSAHTTPTVPVMEPPSTPRTNDWLEIKPPQRFAPSQESILPQGYGGNDTISHVREVQLPPYQGDDEPLHTERTVIGEPTADADTSLDDTPPFDVEDAPIAQTEILQPERGITDVGASPMASIKSPMSSTPAADALAQSLEDAITPRTVEHVADYTPYRFDRPTPATPSKKSAEPAPKAATNARPYVFPPTSLLSNYAKPDSEEIRQELEEKASMLVQKMAEFGIEITVENIRHGPTVTLYEVLPGPGVRVNTILGYENDIALAMAATGIRFQAPIPGKSCMGIEIPNRIVSTVGIRNLLENPTFTENTDPLFCVLGEDVVGKPLYFNLDEMPHLLVAGATGSGKSVCISTIITSILFRSSPEDVKLILIDPKKVEFPVYSGLPHLLIPPITNTKKAAGALRWAVTEMDRRYSILESSKLENGSNASNIKEYNQLRKENPSLPHLPLLVIIIDEFSDLMQTAGGDVESSVIRLTQLARAAGIYLIIGTQRPSVKVITGDIKANIPSRIAFAVASQIDSRTILDAQGAEGLVGKGDMLYAPSNAKSGPLRAQGAFISKKELGDVVEYIKRNNSGVQYDDAVTQSINTIASGGAVGGGGSDAGAIGEDEVEDLKQAVQAAVVAGTVSASYLQKRLRWGFQKASRMLSFIEALGIVEASSGSSRPREVKLTQSELDEMLQNDDIWTSVKI